jgi:hypothetical protein
MKLGHIMSKTLCIYVSQLFHYILGGGGHSCVWETIL